MQNNIDDEWKKDRIGSAINGTNGAITFERVVNTVYNVTYAPILSEKNW